jgi:hypothetical protein
MSLIDEFLPTYQFSERHQTMVRCRPGELLDIIQNFEPPPDRFTDTLMVVRQIFAGLLHRASPSRFPAPQPFTRGNFAPLGRDGDREIVGGLVGRFWRPDFGLLSITGAPDFLACNAPRTAKLALGFSVEGVDGASRLTTETRVYCPDKYSYLMFLPYWLAIRPFSGIIRRRALRTFRSIAEARAVSA